MNGVYPLATRLPLSGAENAFFSQLGMWVSRNGEANIPRNTRQAVRHLGIVQHLRYS